MVVVYLPPLSDRRLEISSHHGAHVEDGRDVEPERAIASRDVRLGSAVRRKEGTVSRKS